MSVRDLIPWNRNAAIPAPSTLATEAANPFLTLHREVNRLFDDVFTGFGSGASPAGRWSPSPPRRRPSRSPPRRRRPARRPKEIAASSQDLARTAEELNALVAHFKVTV